MLFNNNFFKKQIPENFPLVHKRYRIIPNDYTGYIYIWDIDGTYLNTNVQSILALMKVPFENAKEKKNVPGSDIILRHLRIGTDIKNPNNNPIFFITASPPQFENVLRKKMKIDKVKYDGITYKDYLKDFFNMGFNDLFKQITYKLISLLNNRLIFPKGSKEILFGDNLEQDSKIYTLYEQLLDKNIDINELSTKLIKLKVHEPYLSQIIKKSSIIRKEGNNPVERIYIHLTRSEDISIYKNYPVKLIPVENYFQASASLYENNNITINGVEETFKKLKFYDSNIIKSLIPMVDNGYIKRETQEKLQNRFSSLHLL